MHAYNVLFENIVDYYNNNNDHNNNKKGFQMCQVTKPTNKIKKISCKVQHCCSISWFFLLFLKKTMKYFAPLLDLIDYRLYLIDF